ncbi:hypothetical protein PDESU_03055 [Pontiella desulfatans]|uniref:Flavinylation-associated cytochrome domain-containing protein n=1 Tax=Pontiella desulfatans TaxID=2750659 RepID=A0A6C2U3M2_PONDE|nr:DUF4405 domain-containing protein [Pontiella desulfatans]VGO14493.1 hypothetical protein PDESU_03055 [Pontiella desulfatans]
MTLRKTTSLTTLLSFILLLFTSIILYVTPQGKIAFWANWKMLGIGKEEWGALHTNLGFLFIIAGILHTVLNWKPIVAYMKNKAQQLKVFTGDFNLALGITLVIVLFTMFELPPIVGVQRFNEKLKDAAAKEYGEPPYGHAEASPLKSFCKRTGLDVDESIKKMEEQGLEGVSDTATLAQIAEANAMTPQQVYNLIKPAPVAKSNGMPEHPGTGFGRKTLGDVCGEFKLDTDAMIKGLKGEGIEAEATATMKAIAEKHSMDPHGIYEVMLQLQ